MPCTNSNKMELIAFIFIVILGELLDIPLKGKTWKDIGNNAHLDDYNDGGGSMRLLRSPINMTDAHVEVREKSPT